MKKNEQGFALIEAVLIIIALTLIGGVGFYVVNANKDKKESTLSSQSTQKMEENSKEEKRPDLIDYSPTGVSVTKMSEVNKLSGASESFKKFIASLVPEVPKASDVCGQPLTVTVNKIYKDKFASGGISECTGAAHIWKNEDESWKKIFAGQVALPCKDANTYKVPSQISEECQDENVEENYGIVKNPN